MKDLPVNVVYSEVGRSITNALLYQLSYSGVFRISHLAFTLPLRLCRRVAICACFSSCAVQNPAQGAERTRSDQQGEFE